MSTGRKPTINKTILVIGSVTADQYRDARLSVLEKGHKPKIIRTTFEEFFFGSEELVERIATPEEAAQEAGRGVGEASDMASLELLHELAVRHYSSFGDIGAIVVDQEIWSRWDSSSVGCVVWMDHARMVQTDYADRWIAYDSGKVEYVG